METLESVVSSVLIRSLTSIAVWRAGFKWKSAELKLPTRPSVPTTLHYLERAPVDAVVSDGKGAAVPTLVLIPGLTMEATVFVPMAAKLNLPQYRIIVVELPAQGENR